MLSEHFARKNSLFFLIQWLLLAVVMAQRLFGDPDYLMQVVTRDLSSFQKLYDQKLSAMPGVQHLRSTLVMKTVVQDRPFPLETLK